MKNLQVIATVLGLRITKNSSGYHLNNGGYSRGIQFDNLHSLSIHLAKIVSFYETFVKNS
jgi:hypothetical protein|tara:strand:+ start:50 stop:229 length:180 start_codon:yes stop_codon:yes gene_type:complete